MTSTVGTGSPATTAPIPSAAPIAAPAQSFCRSAGSTAEDATNASCDGVTPESVSVEYPY
ncbi:putative hemolysin [Catenulispora sp. MAP12-49]